MTSPPRSYIVPEPSATNSLFCVPQPTIKFIEHNNTTWCQESYPPKWNTSSNRSRSISSARQHGRRGSGALSNSVSLPDSATWRRQNKSRPCTMGPEANDVMKQLILGDPTGRNTLRLRPSSTPTLLKPATFFRNLLQNVVRERRSQSKPSSPPSTHCQSTASLASKGKKKFFSS